MLTKSSPLWPLAVEIMKTIDQYAETDPVLTLWISVLAIAGDTDPFTVKYEINALDRMASTAWNRMGGLRTLQFLEEAHLLENQAQFLTQVLNN